MRTLVFVAILLLTRPSAGVRSAPAEVARIRWHLARVEAQLRSSSVSALTPVQRAARAKNLDVLHEYWVRGVFPANTDFPGRHVPYFIDRFGTRCAMAYLIEQSGSANLVHRIATTRNNAYVRDLKDDAELGAWLRANGLSVAEAARIQPEYGSPSDDFAGRWDGTVTFGSSGTTLRFILSNERGNWMLTFPARTSMMPSVVTLDGDSLVLEGPAGTIIGAPQFGTRMSTVLHYRGHTLTGTMKLHHASGADVRGTMSATLQCEGHDSPESVASFARALKLRQVRCMTEIGGGLLPGGVDWSAHTIMYRNIGGQYRYASRTAVLWGDRVGWIVSDVMAIDSNTAGMFHARPQDVALTSLAFLKGLSTLGLELRWSKTLLQDPNMPRFVPAALIAALHDTLDVPLAELLVSTPRIMRDPELLAALAHLPVAPDSVWRRNDGGLVYGPVMSGYGHARNAADEALWEQSLALIAAPGTSHDVLLTLATWRDRHPYLCPGRPSMSQVVPLLKERATREGNTAILAALATNPARPRAPNTSLVC